MSSAQLRACAESALKATQKTDKIELDDKSCKKYNQELMKITFNKQYSANTESKGIIQLQTFFEGGYIKLSSLMP